MAPGAEAAGPGGASFADKFVAAGEAGKERACKSEKKKPRSDLRERR